MIFGPTPLHDALGAILAHSIQTPTGKLAKGTHLGQDDLARLAEIGLTSVMTARLAADDSAEDSAATALANALAAGSEGFRLTPAHTGRVNLIATRPGLIHFDTDAIHALNLVHPSITLATLPLFAKMASGTLAATVKIISYAVPHSDLDQAQLQARQAAMINLPVTRSSASLILTTAMDTESRLEQKGRDAVLRRLRALNIALDETITVAHVQPDLSGAIGRAKGDMILILTGAATSDLHDVAPNALRQAGGVVSRFGMPVDPGNLLFHGKIGLRPVIGLPGCVRSPALNGADWVLERIACGVTISDDMIARMGVGGLLKETPSRPSPRQGS